MELTYESVTKWFDGYFEACNKNQGPIETVRNLRKFFTDDFQFNMYTPPPWLEPPLSREGLLMTFVHPGMHEALVPHYYVIDLQRLIVVVQFQLEFVDQNAGTTWPPLQASAHYHLVPDDALGLKVKEIKYWTETSKEDLSGLFEVWGACKDKALTGLANDYFATGPSA